MARGTMAVALGAMATLAACAGPPRDQTVMRGTATDATEMVEAGPAQTCVDLQRIRETRVRDDQTIDFVMQDGTTLRNTLPQRCPSLGFERSFSYSTSLSRLCNVDIITVVHQGGGLRRGASCGLGQFQPVRPAGEPAPAVR